MKKRLFIFFLVLAIILAGAFLVRFRVQGQQRLFKVDTVKTGEMSVTILASGEIKAERDALVQFPASGLLAWVGVKKNDVVKKGQALASLDTRELRKKLEKTLNLYQTQRNSFEQTQEDYKDEKEKALLTEAIKRILDNAQNNLNNAVLDVELNDLAIKLSTIYAPFAGVVVSDVPYAGTNILPSTASIHIVDPQSLYFEALVDETDIAKIKTGETVKIRLDAFPEEVFEGVVSKIDLTSSLSSGGGTVYKTMVTFKDPVDRFRLGMNGDAEFILNSVKEATLVPLNALWEKESKTYVWKVQNGRAVKTEVAVASTNDDWAQITTGVTAGDQVVTSNLNQLKEGMAIRP